MCLDPNHKKVRVATEDIIVFKVIKKDGWGLHYNLQIGKKSVKWEEGKHYTEETPFRGSLHRKTSFMDAFREISGHAFHSSKSYFGAQNNKMHRNDVIKIMIIPKGAKYFESDYEYASSEIIYPHADDYRVTSLTKKGKPKAKLTE